MFRSGRYAMRLVYLAAALFCFGCAEPPPKNTGPQGPGDPAELDGVLAIEPIEPTNDPSVKAISPTEVEVQFIGGPVCLAEPLEQQPGAVAVDYKDDEVKIVVDPETRNCGLADAMGFPMRMRLVLTEPIDGREVTFETRR